MMKNKFLILTITLLAFLVFANSETLFAQSYKAQNITASGEITDGSNKMIGKIEKDGTVKDHTGRKLGHIASNGIVTDAKGIKIGKAEKNGSFIDNKGNIEMTLDSKGEVKDSKGHTLYKVHPDFTHQACAIHCFFKERSIY